MRRENIKFAGGVLSAVLGLLFVGFLGEAAAQPGEPAAGEGQVIINEVMWMGSTAGSSDEWIELRNMTDEEVGVGGWVIENAAGSNTPLEIPAGMVISANGFFLLANYPEDNSSSALNVSVDWVIAGLSLSNGSNGNLILKNAGEDVIDQVQGEGGWPAGENSPLKKSMERNNDPGGGLSGSNWHQCDDFVKCRTADSWDTANGDNYGTPGAANSEPAVNNRPEAVIEGESSGLAGEEMSFLGETSSDLDGDELEHSWLFGDSDSASGVEAVHAYEEAGTYVVTLTVSDGELEDEAELLVTITAPVYSNDIVINEFLPNPIGSDATGEFIELKNISGETVNIESWQLDDGEGGSNPFVISDEESLAAGEVRFFGRVETKIALNNSGDTVRLLDPAGEVKSSFSYSEPVAEGLSYNRLEDGSYALSTTVTAGEENVITGEAEEEEEDEGGDLNYSNDIVINEFLPNPAGSDTVNEFIELKNVGSEEVSLAGWQIDDEDGGSSVFTISAGVSLGGGKLKVLMRSETKIALNNSGDMVRLLDPAGEVKSSFSYSEPVAEGLSYNRVDDSYVLSTTSTPGEENVITEEEKEDEDEDDENVNAAAGEVAGVGIVQVALKDVRGQELGAMVEVEGVVSVPPGVFGEKVMYLAGSGIQIYFYKEDYPELALGDKVKVRGELTTSLGEYRVKLSDRTDIVVISEDAVPLPHEAKTGEIGEALEGTLVIFAGSVVRTSGDTFYVDDGSGEIKVFIKKTTQIDKPKMKKGVVVTITGVVSRTNTGYRVLPRWQEDVRLGRVAGLTSFPIAGKSLMWLIVVVLVWLSVVGQACEAREPLLKYFKLPNM